MFYHTMNPLVSKKNDVRIEERKSTTKKKLIQINNNDNIGPMSAIREVHSRRYLLRRSALEIFLVDQTNHFFNFSTKERSKVYRLIVDQKPPNLA